MKGAVRSMFIPIVFGLVGLFLIGAFSTSEASSAEAASEILNKIRWYGHDTFRIDVGMVIYTDPFRIEHEDTADIILVSHEHYDHCSPEDIKKLSGPDTVIVAPKQCKGKLSGKVVFVEPGGITNVNRIQIEAVPAYNVNKQFHPRDRGGVGFVITAGGVRVYFAGDTDRIPEMKELEVDIALLPVSGTYVMNPEEAAAAVADMQPRYVIPMHYGSIVGTVSDAKRFEQLVKCELKGKVEVKILEHK